MVRKITANHGNVDPCFLISYFSSRLFKINCDVTVQIMVHGSIITKDVNIHPLGFCSGAVLWLLPSRPFLDKYKYIFKKYYLRNFKLQKCMETAVYACRPPFKC